MLALRPSLKKHHCREPAPLGEKAGWKTLDRGFKSRPNPETGPKAFPRTLLKRSRANAPHRRGFQKRGGYDLDEKRQQKASDPSSFKKKNGAFWGICINHADKREDGEGGGPAEPGTIGGVYAKKFKSEKREEAHKRVVRKGGGLPLRAPIHKKKSISI